jgi:hypothetical protein
MPFTPSIWDWTCGSDRGGGAKTKIEGSGGPGHRNLLACVTFRGSASIDLPGAHNLPSSGSSNVQRWGRFIFGRRGKISTRAALFVDLAELLLQFGD